MFLHLAQFGAGDNGQVGQIELRITAAAVAVAGGGDENRHFAVEKRDATKLSFLLLLLRFQWILELEASRKTICRAL